MNKIYEKFKKGDRVLVKSYLSTETNAVFEKYVDENSAFVITMRGLCHVNIDRLKRVVEVKK